MNIEYGCMNVNDVSEIPHVCVGRACRLIGVMRSGRHRYGPFRILSSLPEESSCVVGIVPSIITLRVRGCPTGESPMWV